MLSFSEYQELGGRLTDEVIYAKLEHDAVQLLNTASSESFAAGGIGSAIMNRLLKAAGHHVIDA